MNSNNETIICGNNGVLISSDFIAEMLEYKRNGIIYKIEKLISKYNLNDDDCLQKTYKNLNNKMSKFYYISEKVWELLKDTFIVQRVLDNFDKVDQYFIKNNKKYEEELKMNNENYDFANKKGYLSILPDPHFIDQMINCAGLRTSQGATDFIKYNIKDASLQYEIENACHDVDNENKVNDTEISCNELKEEQSIYVPIQLISNICGIKVETLEDIIRTNIDECYYRLNYSGTLGRNILFLDDVGYEELKRIITLDDVEICDYIYNYNNGNENIYQFSIPYAYRELNYLKELKYISLDNMSKILGIPRYILIEYIHDTEINIAPLYGYKFGDIYFKLSLERGLEISNMGFNALILNKLIERLIYLKDKDIKSILKLINTIIKEYLKDSDMILDSDSKDIDNELQLISLPEYLSDGADIKVMLNPIERLSKCIYDDILDKVPEIMKNASLVGIATAILEKYKGIIKDYCCGLKIDCDINYLANKLIKEVMAFKIILNEFTIK